MNIHIVLGWMGMIGGMILMNFTPITGIIVASLGIIEGVLGIYCISGKRKNDKERKTS